MGALHRSVALLLVAAAFGGVSVVFNPGARAVLMDRLLEDEITPAAASALGPDVLWLDARDRAAFEAGHVSGAMLLNEDDWGDLLPQVIERWQPGTPIVVYCDSEGCGASRKVAERLRTEAGIQNAKVLHGDWTKVDASR